MKNRCNIFIPLTVFLLLNGCIHSNHSNEETVKKQADNLANYFNDSTLAIFTHWEYEQYPEFDVWRKACWDKGLYTKEYHTCYYAIVYRENSDSTTLSIGYTDNFKTDFPFTLQFDTSIYSGLWFSKKQNGYLTISTNKIHQGDLVVVNLKSEAHVSDFFKTTNPFDSIQFLEKVKNEIGVIKTLYRPEVGNYIQFYLNDSSIVTYFPDNLHLNKNLKKYWEPILYKGQKIKNNWYLRIKQVK